MRARVWWQRQAMARWLMVGLAAVLTGCGSVSGYPCEKEFASQCDGIDVAHCERADSGGLKWRVYECPSVCGLNGCNWTGAKVGMACPARVGGWCSADGELTTCSAPTPSHPGVWAVGPCPRCVKGAKPSDVLRPVGDGTLACN